MIQPAITILLEADITIIKHRLGLRKEPLKSTDSYYELQGQFKKYLSDPKMEPWLGRVIKLKSESYADYQKTFEDISVFLNSI